MPARPQVLLLHGIWNHPCCLWPLARRLRAGGFAAHIWGYASVLRPLEHAIAQLAARLARAEQTTCLIGHSLGGLIALETLRRQPHLPVSRVVCLGSPLQGSQIARTLLARGWGRYTLGHSAALLQTGIAPWQGRAQVGMVAGTVARGVGRCVCRLAAPSDGTVRVAETHLAGLADHCLVRASHGSLLFSAAAARQSMQFLRHGCFAKADETDVRDL